MQIARANKAKVKSRKAIQFVFLISGFYGKSTRKFSFSCLNVKKIQNLKLETFQNNDFFVILIIILFQSDHKNHSMFKNVFFSVKINSQRYQQWSHTIILYIL